MEQIPGIFGLQVSKSLTNKRSALTHNIPAGEFDQTGISIMSEPSPALKVSGRECCIEKNGSMPPPPVAKVIGEAYIPSSGALNDEDCKGEVKDCDSMPTGLDLSFISNIVELIADGSMVNIGIWLVAVEGGREEE